MAIGRPQLLVQVEQQVDFQCPLPVRCGGARSGTASYSEVFSSRLYIRNIFRCYERDQATLAAVSAKVAILLNDIPLPWPWPN
jgi:hypothetical protein